jgi:sugar O-acyltransferase (sialic acid O-acetyltransferase NeuD family)
MINLVIVGAGGFGLEVASYAQDVTRAGHVSFAIQGFMDDTKPVGSMHGALPVLGGTDMELLPDAFYILAVGSPEGRLKLAEKLGRKGARWAKIIHPLSYVAPSAQLAEGVVIAPFAFVGPEAQIDAHALINIHTTVGHETRLGEASVLAPYSGLMGRVQVQRGVFLGAQAIVTPGLTLHEGCTLAAGSVAYTDIPARANALGNPARYRPE